MESEKARIYIAPETGEPHIHNHGIFEDEIEEVFLSGLGQDRVSREGSKTLMGQTEPGRYLRIIYSPEPESVFVITAYELRGKSLPGFKRRQRRRK